MNKRQKDRKRERKMNKRQKDRKSKNELIRKQIYSFRGNNKLFKNNTHR